MLDPVRIGPGMGLGNEYVDFSNWARQQAIDRWPILTTDGIVLDQQSTAARCGTLIFKQGRGTTKDDRRFEYSCVLKVDSASEEDVAKLAVVGGCMRLWWIPQPPVNNTLAELAVDAGVDQDDWQALINLADGVRGRR